MNSRTYASAMLLLISIVFLNISLIASPPINITKSSVIGLTYSVDSFPINTATRLPTWLLLGQSNSTNFWKAFFYNNGATERHVLSFSESLEAHYGVDTVFGCWLNGVDGQALGFNENDTDWNVNSEGELYDDLMYKIGNDPYNGEIPFFGMKRLYNNEIVDLRFVLWLQGESDASNDTWSRNYKKNLKDLINKTRDDLKKTNLPWIIVRLNPNINRTSEYVEKIRVAVTELSQEDENIYIIDIDDFVSADYAGQGIEVNVHYSVQGLDKIEARARAIVIENGL